MDSTTRRGSSWEFPAINPHSSWLTPNANVSVPSQPMSQESWFGLFLQWKVCLQRVISGLFLRLLHQSVKIMCRHVQTLRERVQRDRSQELLDIFAVAPANVPHPGICVAISIGIPIARSTASGGLPLDHADKGRGIIFASTSTKPASSQMFRSLDPIRRSFRSSNARMY